jgi:hypothetical protein
VKVFAFICSIYILLLSTAPCCAFENCKDETKQAQKSDRHENNGGCKNCSPFNQCGDCNGFTLTAGSMQVDTPQPLVQQVFPGYIHSFLPQYISSFWKPPRLG